ncbi:long-chain fatty acid transporter [Veronia nyctiphanis]|uniref:Long-chain fatty acid transporter n=1 Tax=Veronia nyctiphanis TaxID=1278244 RepID=A0A4Q0YR26_9GAMM|nr:outer membrane protein transport protein [Veronia nyctiphanis]RXJ73617.1 long-chain fatty acid transporter [Veronia nyctiphanis]
MKRILRKSLLSTAILLAASQAHGAGFQLLYQSAEGLGRVNAGEGAILSGASVGGRNAAAIAMLDSSSVSVGVTFVKPDVKVNGTATGAGSFEHDSVANDGIVPNLHYARPINDQLALGLSLGSFYGTSTEFPEDSIVGAQTGETELTTIDANFYAGYKINPNLSIGGGVNIVKADAKMIRRAGLLAPGIPGGATASTKVVDVEGDAMGYGWNIGALWQLDENSRFSLTYRSAVDLKLEGDFTGLRSSFAKTPAELKVELPSMAELSGFHQLNSSLAVHYSATLTGWSSFQELKATSSGCLNGECLQKDEKWEDSWRYSVGATYDLSDMLTLRGGIALDQSPVPDAYRTMSIPDSDRMRYGLGATVNVSSNLSIDAGMSLIDGKKESGTEALSPPAPAPAATFTSEPKALVFALQANYTF